jgi:hypothetical protein
MATLFGRFLRHSDEEKTITERIFVHSLALVLEKRYRCRWSFPYRISLEICKGPQTTLVQTHAPSDTAVAGATRY